jgi:putative peptidoglycan lipid II flippase
LEARGQLVELRKIVSQTLRAVLFLAIPAAVGLFVWRVPLIRMLLQRGEFTANSTQLTAYALAFYAFGLVGHSVVEIVARAFYALHDTRTPVLITFGGVGLNVLLSLLLIAPLGFGGLAAANTIATLVEMTLMMWLLARRLGGLEWPQLWSTAFRSALATAAMALPLIWLAGRWSDGSAILFGALGLIIGAAIYLGAAVLLRMPEVRVARRIFSR